MSDSGHIRIPNGVWLALGEVGLIGRALVVHVAFRGECWEAASKIAAALGTSEASVKRGITALVGLGWLTYDRPTHRRRVLRLGPQWKAHSGHTARNENPKGVRVNPSKAPHSGQGEPNGDAIRSHSTDEGVTQHPSFRAHSTDNQTQEPDSSNQTPSLALTPPPTTRKAARKTKPKARGWLAEFDERVAKLFRAATDAEPSKRWSAGKEAALGKLRKAQGEVAFSTAFDAFLSDQWVANKSWPVGAFLSQFDKYRKRAPRRNDEIPDPFEPTPEDFKWP